jgi:hypothetical protein
MNSAVAEEGASRRRVSAPLWLGVSHFPFFFRFFNPLSLYVDWPMRAVSPLAPRKICTLLLRPPRGLGDNDALVMSWEEMVMDESLEWPGEADGPKGILRHGRWPNAAVSTLYPFALSYHSPIHTRHARSMPCPWRE